MPARPDRLGTGPVGHRLRHARQVLRGRGEETYGFPAKVVDKSPEGTFVTEQFVVGSRFGQAISTVAYTRSGGPKVTAASVGQLAAKPVARAKKALA